MVHAKMRQNAQKCLLKFKNFLGAMPRIPMFGEGLLRPSPKPTSALWLCMHPAAHSGPVLIVPQCLLAVDAPAYFNQTNLISKQTN